MTSFLLVASCPNTTVANGFLHNHYYGSEHPAGTTSYATCNSHGFNVNGSQEFFKILTCQSNGTWNTPVPNCGT